jgi:glycosyltransferase involved in cell wall biosynthesis
VNKPKIAVLIDWYLPGTKAGGPVRSVYSLINLLKNHFDFYVITSNKDLGCSAPYAKIIANTLFEKDQVHYYFFSAENLSSKNMAGILNQINPQLIYLNSFWSFNFSIGIVNLKNKNIIKANVLLAPRGMLGKGALGLKSLKKRVFLATAKFFNWYKFVLFHATQQQEAADIRLKFKSAKIFTAPNVNSSPIVTNVSNKVRGQVNMFFLSRISEVKNLHFALELLKSIPQDYSVSYDIYGNIENTEYWNMCKKIIEELPKNITATYKHELHFNEVQATISQYHFLLLPTLNENFGHSIVESLLCGCPVIISDQTPWNDLNDFNAGYAIALNDKKQFVDAIIEAAKLNQDDFTKKSKATNDYIQKKIDLTIVLNQYKTLFNDCIKN